MACSDKDPCNAQGNDDPAEQSACPGMPINAPRVGHGPSGETDFWQDSLWRFGLSASISLIEFARTRLLPAGFESDSARPLCGVTTPPGSVLPGRTLWRPPLKAGWAT